MAFTGKPTFGAGRVFMTGTYANPTPARALVPQGQAIDFKRKTEGLFGARQLPDAIGAGEMEITGKVEFGKSSARIVSDIMFGDTSSTGSYSEADGEAGVVSAGPYTVQVVNHAAFLFDLGVVNAATGAIMTCVAAGQEAAGKAYSVAAGVYTFAAGDGGQGVYISYAYTAASSGETVALTSQPQGPANAFQAVHVLPWGTSQDMFVFNNCLASGSGVAAKKSGFAAFTLEYTAAVDAYDQLGVATFAEMAMSSIGGQLDFSNPGDSGFIPGL